MSVRASALLWLLGCLAACGGNTLPKAGTSRAAPVVMPGPSDKETPQAWFEAGARTAAALRGERAGTARNIIVFLGDGMSMTTIAAARILEGQRQGGSGEEHRLSFEQFPYTAFSRTYETDAQTPDSAGTMSAIMTGIKTRFGVISMNQWVHRGDCPSAAGNEAMTALELASAAGLATGVVTTTRITHATPAATYAHSVERDWESDAELTVQARDQGCRDIATQLLAAARAGVVDVALGGGRSSFLPAAATDPEYPQVHGKRLDGRDLVAEWQRLPAARFIWNAAQFSALDASTSGPVLGLFEPEHMRYEHERSHDGAGEPSLAEMTSKAIALLDRRAKGYFLVVEGGRIDHAHHDNNAFRALDETIALSTAVRAAQAASNDADTLIVVTADHSHTLVMGGYPARGNPILGKARGPDPGGSPAPGVSVDALGRSYTTLAYANGPGSTAASDEQPAGPKRYPHESARFDGGPVSRPLLDEIDTEDPDYLQEAGIPMLDETHAGEDVAVFADGPGAQAVRGSLEQNVLFHLMLQANAPMRGLLCAHSACAASGVPLQLPEPLARREGR